MISFLMFQYRFDIQWSVESKRECNTIQGEFKKQ